VTSPLLITLLPSGIADDPPLWRVEDGVWQDAGQLSEYLGAEDGVTAVAIVRAEDARCIWSALPDLEPRQAEGVARLQTSEQSLGAVHLVARHIGDDRVLCAAIDPARMEYGLERLLFHGINPDVVIPLGLTIEAGGDHVNEIDFGDARALRGADFAIPDEAAFRQLFVRDTPVAVLDEAATRDALFAASLDPLLNLRSGAFAKRERIVLATAEQRKWIKRLAVALFATTLMLGLVSWAKYRSAANAENERALAAVQRIDPAITDIEQAETQLARAMQQKGMANGRLAPLSAGLWKAVKASPNVSVRELRFAEDGILLAVLAAPNADAINRALIAIQQDGFRITATPRQDTSGATLVDLSMRMS
jgi:general secretion pathway protein L